MLSKSYSLSSLVKILFVTLFLSPIVKVNAGHSIKHAGHEAKHKPPIVTRPAPTTTTTTEPTTTEDSTLIVNQSPPHLFWRELLERELDEMEDTYAGEPPIDDDVGERTIALLDLKFEVICSGSAITLEWALTASHCLIFIPKYIKSAISNRIVPVQAVYKHPKYNYDVTLRKDEEGLTDVVALEHDIGLVRTKRHMHLPMMMPTLDVLLHEIYQIDPQNLLGQMLTVYGFGRHDTEDKDGQDGSKQISAGRGIASALFKSTLMTVQCARANWYPCVCGASTLSGVCAGDSGGPVFSGQVQIGVTSLGPLKCGAGLTTDQGQTVITSIRPYLSLINRTVFESLQQQRLTESLDHYGRNSADAGIILQMGLLPVVLFFIGLVL